MMLLTQLPQPLPQPLTFYTHTHTNRQTATHTHTETETQTLCVFLDGGASREAAEPEEVEEEEMSPAIFLADTEAVGAELPLARGQLWLRAVAATWDALVHLGKETDIGCDQAESDFCSRVHTHTHTGDMKAFMCVAVCVCVSMHCCVCL